MELEIYFPEDFQNLEQQSQNAIKIQLVNAMCDSIIEDDIDKYDKIIYGLEKEILHTVKPKIWNVHVVGNMEQKIEVDFRLYSISVVDYLSANLETITVFDFYASVRYLKEKFKKT